MSGLSYRIARRWIIGRTLTWHRFGKCSIPDVTVQRQYHVQNTILFGSTWLNVMRRCCWPYDRWAGYPMPKNLLAARNSVSKSQTVRNEKSYFASESLVYIIVSSNRRVTLYVHWFVEEFLLFNLEKLWHRWLNSQLVTWNLKTVIEAQICCNFLQK